MKLLPNCVLLLLLLFVFQGNAQFQLNGVATNLGGGTYQLTPALNSQFGAIWNKVQHNLNAPFNIQGQMNFGADPGGADGICFVMQRSCLTAGGGGGGLGVFGIPGQSFEVEFDTYQNIAGTGVEINNDPVYDHIAVEKNGDVAHDGSANDITAPIQMHNALANVKTGAWYDFQISYDPATTNLKVYFAGVLRVNINYDIKTNAFGGNTYVYWGFTSATGGHNNIQQIKIDNALSTLGLQDQQICTGSVNATLPSLSSLRGTNLALNNPVTASSGAGNMAQAVDGNMGSRWESVWGVDPQWICVDLQSPVDIDSVVLDWEGAYATSFQVQTSLDGTTWTTQYSTTTNTGGHNKIVFSASNVRYVRIWGTVRSLAAYGYSLWEFKVYGLPNYLWSPDDGTVSDIYGETVTLSPTVTTTYSVVIPDPCLGYTTLSITVTINCPLPVEMSEFKASLLDFGAGLEWITASEINTDYFKIIRSENGFDYYQLDSEKAAGNSNSQIVYKYQDKNAIHGIVYYKIITVDFDGQETSSEVRFLKKYSEIVNTIVFENETSLNISKGSKNLNLIIYDFLGREISNETLVNPSDNFIFGGNLTPAYYYLKIRDDNNEYIIKLCKIK